MKRRTSRVLKASDKDSLENAFLKYEIIGGNKDKLFSINRYSGLISFTHEATAQDAGSYDLQLVVKDSGIPVLSATTNLTIILTVSNTTSKIFNSSRTKLNNRVHQYLLIVIVMVAVTLAVPITAGLSICCIRCNDHRRTPENGGLKFSRKQFNKQKDLIVHPHLLSAAWSEVPVVRATSSNASTMRKGSTLTLKKATDVIYQEIDDLEENEQSMPSSPRKDLISSHTDSEDGWSDGDSRAVRPLPAPDPSDYVEPRSSKSDQSPEKYMEPLNQRLFYTEGARRPSRPSRKPNMGYVPDCSQWNTMHHS